MSCRLSPKFAQFLCREIHFAGVTINGVPEHRENDTHNAQDDEHLAPAESQHKRSQYRGRERGAKRRNAIPGACNQRSITYWKPCARHRRRARKHGRLAESQPCPSYGELPQAGDETRGSLRD